MLRVFSLLVFVSLLLIAPARAETYRLNYEAAVLGVVVLGQASYEVTTTPTRFGVRSTLRTSGAARIFDQTEISATSAGSIAGAVTQYARYDLSHSYASKFRRVQLTRAGASTTATVAPRYGNMGTPAASAAQQAASTDPLTAIFSLGRQIGAAQGCTGSVLVFDGRGHYRLTVSGGTQGTFNSGGYNGPSITCAFRYEPIAGFTMSAQERARIPVAQAVFVLPAQGGFAAPLRISVPTPVGAAQLSVTSYQRTE